MSSQNVSAPGLKPYSTNNFDADFKGQRRDLKLLYRFLTQLAPERNLYLIVGALSILQAIFILMGPIFMSIVLVDQILMKETEHSLPDFGLPALTSTLATHLGISMLLAGCLLFVVLQILTNVTSWIHRILFNYATAHSLARLRRDVFTHLLKQPATFWDQVTVGRVTTRVTHDIGQLYELVYSLGGLVSEILPFFIALFIMFATNIELTLLALVLSPVLGIITFFFRRIAQPLHRSLRQTTSLQNRLLQENLTGITIVQLHNRESENLAHYTQINNKVRNQQTYAENIEAAFSTIINIMPQIIVAVLLWYGGIATLSETITLGTLILFTRLANMLFVPILTLASSYGILARTMASCERVFHALDWHEPTHQSSHPVALPSQLGGALSIRNLNFAYGRHSPVLRDVSFEVRAGTRLAIVGPTGSGKSTLMRLLARIYEPPVGSMYLDGVDITDVKLENLRQHLGFMLQDFHIFAGTVLHNITLGNPEISQENAMEAAQIVGADTFINALPQGFATPLTSQGSNLSQGQRQLLVFARILATNPSILILDEATASIDPHTETLIRRTIDRITKGRTSITIAHRLSTVANADQTLVLVDGKVEAIGSQEELLQCSPTFAQLHAMQFSQK